MTTGLIIFGVAVLLAAVLLSVGFGLHLFKKRPATPQPAAPSSDILDATKEVVDHIFDNAFREELRNRGRLHFEKVIGENAMFLQQDLRLTTAQLNDYMKQEIKRVLQEEFAKYEQSITSAKDLALSSMEKTQQAIEQQRVLLEQQLVNQIAEEKKRVIDKFEANMAEIVNHYVMTAIGNEIDLSDQLEYIMQYLEENKQAIVEDIQHGS